MDSDGFESIPLDEEAVAMVAAADAQVRAVDAQLSGMIQYFVMKNKLSGGRWNISADRKSLVRVDQ